MNIFLPPLRPPGSANENAFLRMCVRCGKCVEVCPHGSIQLAAPGRGRHAPFIEPETAPCYLCMKCPPACPTGALDAAALSMENADMGQAYIIKDKCHNYIGDTMCMTCYDRCPLRGQATVLVYGLTPAITDKCVGCGVCTYVCPQKAIEIVPKGSRYKPDNIAALEKI